MQFVFWALFAAMAFYSITIFSTMHLDEDSKVRLSLWLNGDFESAWAEHFILLFERVFGGSHFSLKCFFRSSVASVLAVAALWVLFDQILGLINSGFGTDFQLWQALALGAAINVIPDYLSLAETRFLLYRMARIRGVVAHLVFLLFDLIFSFAIIYVSINLFLFMAQRENVAFLDLVFFRSFYSIFFYSSVLTSIWAWAFFGTSWLQKIMVSAKLNHILDIDTNPGRTVALLGSIIMFITVILLRPLFVLNESGQTNLETIVCSLSQSESCVFTQRLTKQETRQLKLAQQILELRELPVPSFPAMETIQAKPNWTGTQGSFVHNRIQSLIVDRPSLVVFKIAPPRGVQPTFPGNDLGEITMGQTPVYSVMSVELQGAPGIFDVASGTLTSAKGLSDEAPITWQWSLTPRSAGEHVLRFVIFGHRNGAPPETINEIEHVFVVEATLLGMVKDFVSELDFFRSALVAVVVSLWFLFDWWRTKRWRKPPGEPWSPFKPRKRK